MKKVMVLFILVIIVSFVFYFGYRSIIQHNANKEVEKSIHKLPVFSFFHLNEEVFTYTNPEMKMSLIIYFHPNCEHCQYEVKQLLLHKNKFVNTNILMISPASLVEIKQFKTDYQLEEIPCLNVLWDKERKFEFYFGTATFPTILIYNQYNELQKKYIGEIKIEAIIKHINIPVIENKKSISSFFINKKENNLPLFLFDIELY